METKKELIINIRKRVEISQAHIEEEVLGNSDTHMTD